VVTQADVVTRGIEKTTALSCTDASCSAELGSALGSDYIARARVAVLGQSTTLTCRSRM